MLSMHVNSFFPCHYLGRSSDANGLSEDHKRRTPAVAAARAVLVVVSFSVTRYITINNMII